MIKVDHLVVHFKGKDGHRYALDDISLEILRGETLGVVGESGSGKTTLGRVLLGLLKPASGSITSNFLSHTMGIVFQDPYSSLNPKMRAGSIIGEPLKIHGLYSKARVLELLHLVALDDSYVFRYPHELSGGEKQRVAIARALALSPEFLILDEPTSALDATTQKQIIDLLKTLQDKLKLTYLFITHDLPLIRFFANSIIVMQRGKIVERGTAKEVFSAPQHPYTQLLVKSTEFTKGDGNASRTP